MTTERQAWTKDAITERHNNCLALNKAALYRVQFCTVVYYCRNTVGLDEIRSVPFLTLPLGAGGVVVAVA